MYPMEYHIRQKASNSISHQIHTNTIRSCDQISHFAKFAFKDSDSMRSYIEGGGINGYMNNILRGCSLIM